MEKIYRPCSQCYDEETCRMTLGCYRWKAWFRAYWKELRRKYYADNHD